MLSSHLEDFVDVGWLIIYSHLGPGEVPSFFITPLTILIVNVTVLSAAIVGHPHVKATIDELKGPYCLNRFILQAHLSPLLSILAHAVLNQYRVFNCNELFFLSVNNFSGDSEEGKHPAISGLC